MSLEDIFAAVLQMSFYGSLGCGVLLICVLIDHARASRCISMVLWGLVALRLVLPFSVPSRLSLFRFCGLPGRIERALDFDRAYGGGADQGSARHAGTVAAGSLAVAGSLAMGMEDGEGPAYPQERENAATAPVRIAYGTFLYVGARVWLVGMTGLWAWAVFSYVRLRRRLRFSMRIAKGVYETDAVPSPCVVGLVRPRIFLTPHLTECQRAHILLHEQMHIHYLDPVWKVVSFVVVSIHWFNPFLWVMYRLFQGELEKACDERVLARIGEDHKEDYSESLLALAVGRGRKKRWSLMPPVAFGEDDIKARIERILSYKKPLILVSVLVVALSAAGCAFFMTAPEDGATTGADDKEVRESEQDVVAVQPEADTEVYEELWADDAVFQARADGIYRVGADGADEERIYDRFAGAAPLMEVFEGRLYFRTDKTYTEGALDWRDDTIRWIDLRTLESGDLTQVREEAMILFFSIYEGWIVIRYMDPDVTDTMMLYIDGEPAFNGKSITQLSVQEQDQLGRDMARAVLQGSGRLVDISNRVQDQNIAYIDMDGDDRAERILLEPSRTQQRDEVDPLRHYHLQIGDADLEGFGENMSNTLWAVSLDGKKILLILYEDGPSADPYTHFFSYENGQIRELGGFADDIRLCGIRREGIISGQIRLDVVQTDWVGMQWRIGESGLIEEIAQDAYGFKVLNWVDLKEALPLHPGAKEQETFEILPQKVRFLETTADQEWVLVETQGGQRGWIHVDAFEVVELRRNVMDIFDGLNMAG